MKRAAIITIAGSCTRFSKSLGLNVHKAIYSECDHNQTILAFQLNLVSNCCDEIIIVSGFKHNEIENYLKNNFSHLNYKLVYNEHYLDYGSCFSLILGINAICDDFDEVIFIEGDLVFDTDSFDKLVHSPKNVITANNHLIDSKTAVIFYVNEKNEVKYLYDVNHLTLKIDEPFIKIGNSGQVWKFTDLKKLKKNILNYTSVQYKGTNLVPVNDYYQNVDYDKIEIIAFKNWFNCNTVKDYRTMKEYIDRGNNNAKFI